MDERGVAVGQAFILDAKKYWSTVLYSTLKSDYRRRVRSTGREPHSAADVQALIGDTTLYRYYAWLERHLQRFKYSGRYGLVPYHRERAAALLAPLEQAADDPRLELDPDLVLPPYCAAVDIHQHPGGVWGEPIAGLVYERGARSTTPMMGSRHRDLHQRFTDLVSEGGISDRILDMGCGFGKSTKPFYETFPEAEIEAVDLAAPCLKLACHDAVQAQAQNVRFRQMNAYETDYAEDSFDLVTSTMLIHELPPKEIDRLFDEAHRVLAPGGRMVHLDFHVLPDAFAQFIHYGHGRRNNEPFMQPWAEMDVAAVLAAKGFRNVSVEPFAEADGVEVTDNPSWRFPWTVIAAEKA